MIDGAAGSIVHNNWPGRDRAGRDRARARARFEVLIIVAASLVGIVARLFPSSPLWLDEALSVNIADQPARIDRRLAAPRRPSAAVLLRTRRLDACLRLVRLRGPLAVDGAGLASPSGSRSSSRAVTEVVSSRRWPRSSWRSRRTRVRYSSETRMYALVMVLVLIGWLALDAAIAKPTVLRLLPLTLGVGRAVAHALLVLLLDRRARVAVGHARVVRARRAQEPHARRDCDRRRRGLVHPVAQRILVPDAPHGHAVGEHGDARPGCCRRRSSTSTVASTPNRSCCCS